MSRTLTQRELLVAESKTEGPRALRDELEAFLDRASRLVDTHPWLVVVAMHEYFRCIYPADPHLPFDEQETPLARVRRVLGSCRRLLEARQHIASYFEHGADVSRSARSNTPPRRAEAPTQQVYGRLWDQFEREHYLTESVELLKARLVPTGLKEPMFTDRIVLDAGCGSGRFTMAMAMMGARLAHGVDLGATSLENARRVAKEAGLPNVEFRVGDALALPYDDQSFDFVWCNGVLHHTQDIERGLRELYRVLKPGAQAFVYLYGDGGLFWHSRRRMRPIMQRIPQEYTMAVLGLLGMPRNRFIFADTWYVPIERHTGRAELEVLLSRTGFSPVRKVVGARSTDLDRAVEFGGEQARLLWGEGEHRYLVMRPCSGDRA